MSLKVAVIGGGASGMMAAINCAYTGAKVVLLERNDRVGKKLLATGNGRCNYTNENMKLDFLYGEDHLFIEKVMEKFNRDQTVEFFEKIGIVPASEGDGKIFPLSFQSSSVLDVLRYEMEKVGIEVLTDSYVVEIKKEKDFLVKLKEGKSIRGDRVIVTTGGRAMPVSGSDGNGYGLVKPLGHGTVETTPALVQLKLKGDIFKQINGVKFVGRVVLYIDGKRTKEDFGDVLFTDYGISGPPVLQISREAIRAQEKGIDTRVRISIISGKTKEEVFSYLKERFKNFPERTLDFGLVGLINKRLILPILKELDLDKNKVVGSLENREIEALAEILTSWEFPVIGNKGWGQAQTTAGGIMTKDINPDTMESKLVKGLFFAGEILDVDGDCGGYNLQWAWSSGYLAGLSAGSL
ncbi:NAD(P)/FAD-dependent oxidoreductase [Gudongella sp. DL1XJH-153]|uniref:NAD(P)/FAD-dependent oxidoreductase n=1 Tax=Gudongella sp. DL1XJH-153 TaxID=3409804 RepID=UPI003BB50947